MRFAKGDGETEPDEDEDIVWDLMFGVGPWHIQSLCVNDMGMGFTPQQIGDMTLDMLFMLLADKKVLRKSRKSRSMKSAAPIIAEDGTSKGRTKDGVPFTGRVRGKSLARELMEKEAASKKESGWQRRSRLRAERKAKRNKG